MKKLIALLIMIIGAVSAVFSQDITMSISGELYTGLFWYKRDVEGEDKILSGAYIHNSQNNDWLSTKDYKELKLDQGLFRLNFNIEKGIMGAQFRFQTTDWIKGNIATWGYAFL